MKFSIVDLVSVWVVPTAAADAVAAAEADVAAAAAAAAATAVLMHKLRFKSV